MTTKVTDAEALFTVAPPEDLIGAARGDPQWKQPSPTEIFTLTRGEKGVSRI
jgi:hypothetical protein